jgi:hypothetical protein
MISTDSTTDALSKKIAEITLEHETNTTTIQSSDYYYETRQGSKKVNFVRLEKGLLLFIYIHETKKSILHSEIALWDYRSCLYLIKDVHYSKSTRSISSET